MGQMIDGRGKIPEIVPADFPAEMVIQYSVGETTYLTKVALPAWLGSCPDEEVASLRQAVSGIRIGAQADARAAKMAALGIQAQGKAAKGKFVDESELSLDE